MLEYQGFLILWALFIIAHHFDSRQRLRARKFNVMAIVFLILAALALILNPAVRQGFRTGYEQQYSRG